MSIASSKEAPWPVRWTLIAIVSSLLLLAPGLLTGCIERAAKNWSSEAEDLQAEYGTPDSPAEEPAAVQTGRVGYSIDDLWLCGDLPPDQGAIDAATASPDPYDSPLNRYECDGWVLSDGQVLLTDGGRETVAGWGVRTLEPSRMPDSVIPVRDPVDVPVVIPTGTVDTPTVDSAPGRGVLGTGWQVVWLVIRVGVLIVLALVVVVFTARTVKWATRGLRRQRVEASADAAEASGLRHAYPSVDASGTEPEDLDDLPLPPASKFPLPVGTLPDDDDGSDPTGGWA